MRQKIAIAGLKLLQPKEKKLIKFLGKKLVIYPSVFDPRYIFTTKFFAENLRIKEKKVLEIGTGTGILSIIAAKNAKKVLAVDINHFAVKCAQENIKLNKLTNVDVKKSNLFSNVKEKFDLIIFNPPYLQGKPKKHIEYAWYDNGLLKKFFEQANDYLSKKGRILVLYSTIADKKKFERLIKRNDYNFRIIASKYGLFEKFLIYSICHS